MTNTELIQALRNKASRDNRALLDEAANVIERLTKPAENRTGKIDCNITENFLKEKARMTTRKGYSTACSIACDDCPLSKHHNSKGVYCQELHSKFTTEAIAIVQKWSNEHPVKTIKDDFLEKHPNAPKAATGTPLACAWRAGYLDEDGCLCGKCTECWNRPLSEVQK